MKYSEREFQKDPIPPISICQNIYKLNIWPGKNILYWEMVQFFVEFVVFDLFLKFRRDILIKKQKQTNNTKRSQLRSAIEIYEKNLFQSPQL